MAANVTISGANNFPDEQQTTAPKVKHGAKNVLHWFRRGLRLHDHPSLHVALWGAQTLRCVYILDPWFAASQASVNKWRFLIQSLEDLDQSLRKLNSQLFVIRGQPADVLARYIKQWNITHLSFEDDPEPFGKERDSAIKALAKQLNVEVIVETGHSLYNIPSIIRGNKGKVPCTFKKFQRILQKIEAPPKPVNMINKETLKSVTTPVTPEEEEAFTIPTLEQLGFDTQDLPKNAVWVGGESDALHRLNRHLERKAWVACFERPKMTAQSLFASPAGLTPHLKFGCLSARLFYWKLHELFCKLKKNQQPPASLFGQLYWREFFYTVASENPKFDRMVGNPICLQIPWNTDAVALVKWAEGKTGFPWIDAIMTQLKEEGWIHPLARHAVACFLTRGDLWLSWEEGMKIFDELMLDADWSCNAGNWMWLSCSSFFDQFFYTYDPVAFGKQIDPSGDYLRKYLPVLQLYSSEYIFEPWTAPLEVQKAAKCVIGEEYPKPMIDHQQAAHINTERMKLVYQHILSKTKMSKEGKQKVMKDCFGTGARHESHFSCQGQYI